MQRALIGHHIALLPGSHNDPLFGIHSLNLLSKRLVLYEGAMKFALNGVILRADARGVAQWPRCLESQPAAADAEKQAAKQNRIGNVLLPAPWRTICCLFDCCVLPEG